MSFDRTKAQLSDQQLDLAESIDAAYEAGREAFSDGFQAETDIFAIAGASPHIRKLVNAIIASRAEGAVVLGNLLTGAGAAFFNDNLDHFRPAAEPDPDEAPGA